MKTVTVKFTTRYATDYSDKSYDYIVNDDVEVKAGDYAVVHNVTEFAIVRVMEVKVGISNKATKSLVAVLNKSVLDSYTAMNEEINRKKELFVRLEQLLAQEMEAKQVSSACPAQC